MPWYEFICEKCGAFNKRIPEVEDMHYETPCPECGVNSKRTGFHPVPFYFKETETKSG